MDLCQRPLAKPLSVLKDKANVKALSFLRSELLFSELVEVLLSGDQVNDAEGQFFYFRIWRIIRRSNVRTAVVREELIGLLFLPGRINSDRKSALTSFMQGTSVSPSPKYTILLKGTRRSSCGMY